MSGAAQVDPAALTDVARALVRYGTSEESVFAQADAAINATTSRVAAEQARRRQELARAEAALRDCRAKEGADCSVLQLAEQQARRSLDSANQAMRLINAAVGRYQPAKARQSAAVQGLLLGARTHLNRKSGEIGSYLAAGGGGAGGGVGGGGSGGAIGSGGGLGPRADAVVKIAKAAAWELGPALTIHSLSGVKQLSGLDGVDDSLITEAVSVLREPGAMRAGVAMTAEAGYRQLGAALSYIREHTGG